MYYFHNDYNEACHPRITEKLSSHSAMQMPGYGTDLCCARAAQLIRSACKSDNAAVHFLVGGTQCNLTVISASLRPHQAVIGAVSAHINIHETGAIEATGHKVIAVTSTDGKITAEQIDVIAGLHYTDSEPEHLVQPKMVYISMPTELGTMYSLEELEDISTVCRKFGLYLYVDGARLGYGLCESGNRITMADLARLCDVFYIGGTKVGAMFGEAVVISNPIIASDFRYLIKQNGGLLAKGWLLGLQFEALFEDGLYFTIGNHAVLLADQIRNTLEELGYSLLVNGKSNQVFPILPNSLLNELGKSFTFMTQERIDSDFTAVRFCTSWATKPDAVNALCEALKRLTHKEKGEHYAF